MAIRSEPSKDKQLIGVYDTPEHAEAAAARVQAAGAHEAVVDDPADKVDSLRAEMRDELENSWISPPAVIAPTKESAKGASALVPLGALIGAILAMPLGFIDVGGSLTSRLVIAALCGVGMGSTVGFLIGAGTGVRGRFEANAADEGVVVRVPTDTPEIEAAMEHGGVLRLDRVHGDGTPDVTLETEDDHDDSGVFEDMVGHVKAAPHVAGINDESVPTWSAEDPESKPSIEPS
jgi:hypothetical protein